MSTAREPMPQVMSRGPEMESLLLRVTQLIQQGLKTGPLH